MKQTRIDLFLSILRSLRGVGWVLGGRDPLVGIDCVGLVILGLKGIEIDIVDESHYRSEGEWFKLIRFLLSITNRIKGNWKDALPGDILLFTTNEYNNHVGVLTTDGNFIHCSSDPTYMHCLEEKLDGLWKKNLHSIYRIKGLKDG